MLAYFFEKSYAILVLYLDSNFYELQRHLEYFYFQKDLMSINLEKLKIDRKTSIDLITKYSHLQIHAQNVLTYYQQVHYDDMMISNKQIIE